MPELLGYVLIFGSILYLAYIAARMVGKKTSASMQSKHMQVVEQISLGLDKRLLLVRVGSDYFLFLSGKKEFQQVAKVKLDLDKIDQRNEENSNAQPVFDFRRIFEKTIHSNDKQKRQEKSNQDTEKEQQKSDVLQRNIHKLEQMRVKSYDKEV